MKKTARGPQVPVTKIVALKLTLLTATLAVVGVVVVASTYAWVERHNREQIEEMKQEILEDLLKRQAAETGSLRRELKQREDEIRALRQEETLGRRDQEERERKATIERDKRDEQLRKHVSTVAKGAAQSAGEAADHARAAAASARSANADASRAAAHAGDAADAERKTDAAATRADGAAAQATASARSAKKSDDDVRSILGPSSRPEASYPSNH
jgi:membrane protein involved in colicin uptake